MVRSTEIDKNQTSILTLPSHIYVPLLTAGISLILGAAAGRFLLQGKPAYVDIIIPQNGEAVTSTIRMTEGEALGFSVLDKAGFARHQEVIARLDACLAREIPEVPLIEEKK